MGFGLQVSLGSGVVDKFHSYYKRNDYAVK